MARREAGNVGADSDYMRFTDHTLLFLLADRQNQPQLVGDSADDTELRVDLSSSLVAPPSPAQSLQESSRLEDGRHVDMVYPRAENPDIRHPEDVQPRGIRRPDNIHAVDKHGRGSSCDTPQ